MTIYAQLLCYLLPASLVQALTLTDGAHLRSTPDFTRTDNIVGYLGVGAEVKPVTKMQIASGAWALEIRVVNPPDKLSFNTHPHLYLWQNDSAADFKKMCVSTLLNSPNLAVGVTVAGVQKTQRFFEERAASLSDEQLDKIIQTYGERPAVKNVTDFARNRYRGKHSRRMCYRAVKNSLSLGCQSTLTCLTDDRLLESRFDDNYARNAVHSLKTRGFVNLLDTPRYETLMRQPENMPKGAVLVFSKSNGYARSELPGHVEIKLDEGATSEYASDFIAPSPINEGNPAYTLIGVMIKP